MAQSPELTEFYRAYNSWLESGAPEDSPVFSRFSGLCYNLDMCCELDDELYAKLVRELRAQFKKAKLSTYYPFNRTSIEYTDEAYTSKSHLNPLRIKWVKKHLT